MELLINDKNDEKNNLGKENIKLKKVIGASEERMKDLED